MGCEKLGLVGCAAPMNTNLVPSLSRLRRCALRPRLAPLACSMAALFAASTAAAPPSRAAIRSGRPATFLGERAPLDGGERGEFGEGGLAFGAGVGSWVHGRSMSSTLDILKHKKRTARPAFHFFVRHPISCTVWNLDAPAHTV